jgi:hypothetical protein
LLPVLHHPDWHEFELIVHRPPGRVSKEAGGLNTLSDTQNDIPPRSAQEKSRGQSACAPQGRLQVRTVVMLMFRLRQVPVEHWSFCWQVSPRPRPPGMHRPLLALQTWPEGHEPFGASHRGTHIMFTQISIAPEQSASSMHPLPLWVAEHRPVIGSQNGVFPEHCTPPG